jgi:hypothetical protein
MRRNTGGYSGLVLMVVALSACLEVTANMGTGDDDDGAAADDEETNPPPGPVVSSSCDDFTPVMLEWSIEPLGGGDYSVSTLVEVEGPEECYVFDGSHEHDALELFWSDGSSHLIERYWNDHDHAGFGPRECGGGFCEIGDIFELRAVYPDYVNQPDLDDLIDTYGPPDSACGYVANADLLVEEYCGTFTP